jgi:hypothetical protein
MSILVGVIVMEEDKVVKLTPEDINEVYEQIKDENEEHQRVGCDLFEEKYKDIQAANELREMLGLKAKIVEPELIEPIVEPEPKPEPIKPATRRVDKGPLLHWPDSWPEAPLPPANATAFERLLYPRGLLGHCVQYIIDTSPLPDRRLAMAVSLSTCGKGTDRKIIGPSDNGTVLFNMVLAETGAGKQRGITCSRSLLTAMGLERCIVSSGLASIQAIEEIIEGIPTKGREIDANPNALVVIDEVGSWLSRILSKGQGGNISEIPFHLNILWGQSVEDGWIGTKKVGKEMKTFYSVAFSILGFSTENMFFSTLEDRLLTAGFINRMLVWNVGRGALKRVDPKYHWTQCPEWLVRALRRVTQLPAAPFNDPMKLSIPFTDGSGELHMRDFHRLKWGRGAKELWLAFDDYVRNMPVSGDRELWIRAADLTVRLATIQAFYRCSATVDVIDWEWAEALVRYSIRQMKDGIDKHLISKLEHADLANKVREYVKARWLANKGVDQLVPIGQVKKVLGRKVKDIRDLDNVISHVISTGDIIGISYDDAINQYGVRAGRPTIYLLWNKRGGKSPNISLDD